jgi:MFS family permease
LPVAIAPPLALALFQAGGAGLGFTVVTAMAVVAGALALVLEPSVGSAVSGAAAGLRLFSRHAVGLAAMLILTTCGHSAIYGFVPLSAMERGQGHLLSWFFGVYATWLIICRALLHGLSDRVGRRQVLVPAIALLCVGYMLLALPPTAPALVAAALCLAGGGSLLYPTLIALVADRTPPAERGLAIGTIAGAWDIGIVVGSAVIGFVVERTGYGPGFMLGAATAAAGLLVFVVGERRRASPSTDATPS